MDIRIVIFIIVLISYFILRNNPNQEKAKKRLVLISCLLLIIQSGFRHKIVGPDTPGYYGSFMSYCTDSWKDIFSGLFVANSDFRDPAFPIICKAFGTIIPSWQAFLLVIAVFYFSGLGRLWNRYIHSMTGVVLATTLALTLFNVIALSGIRQMITMSIAFYMIPYIEERKWIIVVPTLLVGSLIHISLLFMFAFIPFMYVERTSYKHFLFAAIIIIPLVASSARGIVGFMADQLSNDYYKGYVEGTEQGSVSTYVILCSLISVFLLFNFNKLKNAPKFFTSSVILMTVTAPLIVLNGTMIRIGQYFTVYMMLTIPYTIDNNRNLKNLYPLMIFVLCFLSFSQRSEYYFFWENIPGTILIPWGIE